MTVLQKEGFHKNLLTKMESVGTVASYALANPAHPNPDICNGILGDVQRMLTLYAGMDVMQRIEAGYSIATQYMEKLEEAALGIPKVQPSTYESYKLMAIDQLREELLRTVETANSAIAENLHYYNDSAQEAYYNIRKSYLPLIQSSANKISLHAETENDRVTNQARATSQPASKDAAAKAFTRKS